MRGRPPKPTRLKRLTGNPGKHRLNAEEPRPEPMIPDCPDELGPLARKEWDRLVGELGKLRILTNLDRVALATYCGAYGMWAEATEAIQKYGTMIKSPQGFPIQSPYVAIANRQAELMMRIASEFGFTPRKPQPHQSTAARHAGSVRREVMRATSNSNSDSLPQVRR